MYWLTGVLGVAMALAPYFFGYTNNSAAFWTSVIVGIGVVAVSIVEAAAHDREAWEYWVAGLLGITALLAPFIFQFNGISEALWTSVIGGGLLAVFAGSRLFRIPQT